jgi:hypothetical protein
METPHMPFNRFITFIKPYINLTAGAIAAWLVAKANVLAIPGLGEHGNELQIGIAAALAWGLTQFATQMGDLKWLKGHHLTIAGDAEVQAAALQAPAVALPSVAVDAEHAALMSTDEDLPDDEIEFGAPPMQDPAVVAAAVDSDLEPEEPLSIDEDLPDDDEEFAAPPPDETNMPIQPSQFDAEEVLA